MSQKRNARNLTHYFEAMERAAERGGYIADGLGPSFDSLLDADNIAIWIAAMLKDSTKLRFRAVAQKGQKDYHHVFVEAWHTQLKKWIPIDPHSSWIAEWRDDGVVWEFGKSKTPAKRSPIQKLIQKELFA